MVCNVGIGIGMGLTLCVSSASAVSITPVGPPGYLYSPQAMNEQGDVAFHVQWSYWGATPGEMLAGTEVLRADGTWQKFTYPDAEAGGVFALGEDCSVVESYSFRDGTIEDGGTVSWMNVPQSSDGSVIPYTGSFPYGQFQNVTPDGTFLGFGSSDRYITGFAQGTLYSPLAWNPATGEIALDMPEGIVAASANFWNPAGGYVGLGADEELAYSYLWWDAQGNVTGSFPVSATLPSLWPRTYDFAGVRSDGTLIGSVDNQLMAYRPDGTMLPIGDAFDRNIWLFDANSAGQSVGMLFDFDAPGLDVSAMMFTSDGHGIDLQSLMPADSPWLLTSALDITESGDVLVYGQLRADNSIGQAFIIRGIPSPGGVVIAACAGLMVLAYRRR